MPAFIGLHLKENFAKLERYGKSRKKTPFPLSADVGSFVQAVQATEL